jgi:hypothetical protein
MKTKTLQQTVTFKASPRHCYLKDVELQKKKECWFIYDPATPRPSRRGDRIGRTAFSPLSIATKSGRGVNVCCQEVNPPWRAPCKIDC